MTPFSLVKQRNITIACFALYNFIRKEGLSDEFFTQYEQPNVSFQSNHVCIDVNEDGVHGYSIALDRDYMAKLRYEIVEQLM